MPTTSARRSTSSANHLLEHANVSDTVRDMIGGWVEDTVNMHVAPESTEEQWDVAGLEAALHDVHVPVSIAEWRRASPDLDDADIRERCKTAALEAGDKRKVAGEDVFSQFERNILLQIMDTQWREHFRISTCCARASICAAMRRRTEAGVQARVVRDVRQMLDRFRGDVVRILLTVQVRTEADAQAVEPHAASQTSPISTPASMA